MRRSAYLFLFLILLSLLIPLVSQQSFAGNLTSTYIRLDRQSPSTSTGGLVCATTPNSDNGTENSIQISFPSVFSVNANASNWTVNTSDIPTGSTAWPGIATATNISGTTVTFPSSNLSASTSYCFSFSNSNTLTTPSSTGSYEATVRTKNSSNSTIDSIELGLAIVANDGISVTATAPANPTDFQARLELISSSNGSFTQGTELTYRIVYGSYLTNPTGITVQAEWDLGMIQGASVATEDILDYVVSSASNGYSNTTPVVDILNRTISWNINSIPGNTIDQIVTFRLRTNSSYKSTQPVTFSVHGRVIGPGTQTADSTVTSNYYNSQYVTPTPTPTCVPGYCPTSAPQATPTPTPLPTSINPLIYAVDIRSISATTASILVTSNKNVRARVMYGLSEDELNLTSISQNYSNQHIVNLNSLKPKSRYYFRAIVTDIDGKSSGSGIYVFDTALISTIPQVVTDSIVVSSHDVLLANSLDTKGKLTNIVLPIGQDYAFRFKIDPYDSIKSVRASVRAENVLGASTIIPGDSNSIQITEINQGQFIGKLVADQTTGIYSLVLHIQDYNGNLVEAKVGKLFIVNPLTILNGSTNSGIDNVKVTLFFYNQRLRKYESIAQAITAIQNPIRTRYDGTADTVLPEGQYKAEIEAFGFKGVSVEFTISPGKNNYPIVKLNPIPFDLLSYLGYTMANAIDIVGLFDDGFEKFRSSPRFLEVLTLGAIILFIFLGSLKLSKIFGVPFFTLPFFVFYHLISIFHRPTHSFFIRGIVMDTWTNAPISGVVLHFSRPNGKVLFHTRTNENGEFTASLKDIMKIKINVNKKGYNTFSKVMNKHDLADKTTILITKIAKPEKFGWGSIMWYLESLTGSLFEAFLVLTLITCFFFAYQFGVIIALPCIIVSMANILLWAVQTRHRN